MMLLAAAAITLNSCSEDIDDSDLYTFTGEMMTDHFVNSPDTFSCYLTLLSKVHSSKKSVSTMRDILSARGNYTCFAPTNTAIVEYLDSLMHLDEPEVSSTDVNEIPDSIAEKIVFNSIIENGSDEAYPSTSFSKGPLGTTNMSDRYISIDYGVDEENNTITYVNVKSKIISSDIKVENGYIHVIDKVLSPSSAGIADVIMNSEGTAFFGKLLELTGWAKKMTKVRDTAWEEKYDDIRGEYNESSSGWKGRNPKNRYTKFTAFVEPDSVFEANGITSIEELKTWLKANAFYGAETSWGDDYDNEDNAVNQFVSYHLLNMDLTVNNMVTFANEFGRSASLMSQQKDKLAENFKVNVWEYWETMGKQRRSIKITAIRTGERFINRKSIYSNQKSTSTYRELPSQMELFGVKINLEENDTHNGHIYTIEDMLVWNKDVPEKVLNERMRYDVTALFPEMMTNNIRQNRSEENCGDGYVYFNLDYLDNLMDMTPETKFIYLVNKGYSGGPGSWMNYQIDEFNIRGIPDFTMKLPPVPFTGTYEIRYGINSNNNRGMAQIYLGENWRNLPAIGIPLDLRETAIPTSVTGWKRDSEFNGDDDAINEADKNMRNLGYMKAPRYMQIGDYTGRDVDSRCLRKIIYTGQLEAGKTYYIRFKSVLSTDAEFFFDYLEFVPKTIYAGDIEAEDKW